MSVNDRTSQSLKVSRIAETLLVTDWPGSVERKSAFGET